MKAIKLIFHALFVAANVLVVILFIVAAYSDRVSPEKNVLFSYLGLGFPIFCVLNFLFMLYWLFLAKWKYLLIGVCAFLICWGPVCRYFPLHAKVSTIPQENVLKVLTYNVMSFAYKNHTENSPNRIIQYIANSGADIVCMQEYMESKSEDHLSSKRIAKALSMYPYRSVLRLTSNKYQSIGIAVYSKYPITQTRKVKYDSPFNGSSIHEINVNGKTLTLINNHLESFKLTAEDKTKYSAFIKSLNSDTFDGFKGAVQQKLGPAYRLRAQQALAVAEEVKNAKGEYVEVCGDFNDTPISYAHRTVQGPLKDAFAESGRGMGSTYNQNLFWFRIDNILYSSNMKALNCTVDKIKYSDHYPLWCYLKMN